MHFDLYVFLKFNFWYFTSEISSFRFTVTNVVCKKKMNPISVESSKQLHGNCSIYRNRENRADMKGMCCFAQNIFRDTDFYVCLKFLTSSRHWNLTPMTTGLYMPCVVAVESGKYTFKGLFNLLDVWNFFFFCFSVLRCSHFTTRTGRQFAL